jgi:hypothetical protein
VSPRVGCNEAVSASATGGDRRPRCTGGPPGGSAWSPPRWSLLEHAVSAGAAHGIDDVRTAVRATTHVLEKPQAGRRVLRLVVAGGGRTSGDSRSATVEVFPSTKNQTYRATIMRGRRRARGEASGSSAQPLHGRRLRRRARSNKARRYWLGRLAQRESIALTRRGPLVRSQYRPSSPSSRDASGFSAPAMTA